MALIPFIAFLLTCRSALMPSQALTDDRRSILLVKPPVSRPFISQVERSRASQTERAFKSIRFSHRAQRRVRSPGRFHATFSPTTIL